MTEYEVERVLHRLREKNTLVVGPVLEGHEFFAGMSQLKLHFYDVRLIMCCIRVRTEYTACFYI